MKKELFDQILKDVRFLKKKLAQIKWFTWYIVIIKRLDW